MKKLCALILLALVILPQILLADETFGLIWKPVVVMGDQIFPSYVWANSTRNYIPQRQQSLSESERQFRGDREGQFGVLFTNLNRKGYKIEVIVECDYIMNRSSYETFADEKLTHFEIFPEIEYKWEAIKSNKQPRPVTIKFSVIVDGKPSGKQTQTITLRSVNECPFVFIDRTGKIVDLNFMYAAYVNESHPRIAHEILPEILKQGVIDKVSGYQNGIREVYKQVYAVWYYLKNRGIAYSSLTAPNLNSEDSFPFVRAQYVRTLDDALNTSQANCVDGTVAMASIIYRMGIQPVIVITPNHCFLGFINDPAKGNAEFLETTFLNAEFSDEDLETAKNAGELFSSILDLQATKSYRSYWLAIFQGRANYLEEQNKFNSYNIIDEITIVTQDNKDDLINKLQYQYFLVHKYRQEGLLPIAGN
ncbi:hypothetical protein JW964_27170 [candidate division KSB1 bacterium]|nr:hypothetical protein [candidate division KSB1 bacterium]